jgi:hypothetical protein
LGVGSDIELVLLALRQGLLVETGTESASFQGGLRD